MNTKERAKGIIMKTLPDVDVDAVMGDSDDLGQLELNSLSFIKIIVGMEMEFNIEFEDESLDFSKFTSLGDLCEYVEERQKATNDDA